MDYLTYVTTHKECGVLGSKEGIFHVKLEEIGVTKQKAEGTRSDSAPCLAERRFPRAARPSRTGPVSTEGGRAFSAGNLRRLAVHNM